MVLGKLDRDILKNEIRTFYNAIYKLSSKWIKDLNVRLDTKKLLERNIGKTLFDINHSNSFLDSSPRLMEIKKKFKKWDLIKLKTFAQQRKP